MLDPALDRGDDLACVALEPQPIEVFGHDAELHHEVPREVLRFGLAALLPPKAQEGGLVRAHNNAGVRAANEGATGKIKRSSHMPLVHFLAGQRSWFSSSLASY